MPSSSEHLPPCPLCEAGACAPLHPGYALCATCGLAFLLPGHHLSAAAEIAHYRTHENDPADPRYRRFLDQLAQPMMRRIPPPAHGLDYGSGPGPTLSVMLEERGYTMRIYDPFFTPDPASLARRYDFITCSETAEHFHHPGREFARLDQLIADGGWLGVMTQMFDAADEDFRFADWWYRRDPTHVCFYQPRTMRWIARLFGWTVEFEGTSVALFHVRRS
ncbi:MAG: class I SAM-dependent methyltransferase [Phycisphaeraceae bacterium]